MDAVVVVPVFKHPVKTDLLPFEDRVAMCELAVEGSGIDVSTVEAETGESNVAMLRALRRKYPAGTKLLWICGDDVFEWIDNPRGQAMLKELAGLIVQRRLHRACADAVEGDKFYKAPVNDMHIRAISVKHAVDIDFIYGELPHFSSTLVRKSPASWRAFLPSRVAAYLDKNPHLLAKLTDLREQPTVPIAMQRIDLEVGGSPKRRKIEVGAAQGLEVEAVTESVMYCLDMVHKLQRERGYTALALSLGSAEALKQLQEAREAIDALCREVPTMPTSKGEARDMAEELMYVPVWLARDRAVQDERLEANSSSSFSNCGATGWLSRAAVASKYDARIDVLMKGCKQTLRALMIGAQSGNAIEAEEDESKMDTLFLLFMSWARMKEALGRERAFVSAGGSDACTLVRSSLRLRRRLNEVIQEKDQMVRRTLELKVADHMGVASSGDALQKMLEDVSVLEWSLMSSFVPTTPLEMVHRLLATREATSSFDVSRWFETMSTAINLMLTLIQALTAHICAAATKDIVTCSAVRTSFQKSALC